MRISLSRKIFLVINYSFLIFSALMCVFPVIHVLAISLSSATAVTAGEVSLWPVDFSTRSYEYIAGDATFLVAVIVSLKRVVLGVGVNMILTILAAYPLSKEANELKGRSFYRWFFLISMLFNAGLIPNYMVVKELNLIDSIWALILPGAIPVFNLILLMNFIRGVPKDIEEAAFIDGADYLRTLWTIILPLCKPVLATLILFQIVGHWNSWFDGLIYMNHGKNLPLQSYLQTKVITVSFSNVSTLDLELMKYVSNKTIKMAEIFTAMVPVMIVYPFLQRYFTKGIVMGSVKG